MEPTAEPSGSNTILGHDGIIIATTDHTPQKRLAVEPVTLTRDGRGLQIRPTKVIMVTLADADGTRIEFHLQPHLARAVADSLTRLAAKCEK